MSAPEPPAVVWVNQRGVYGDVPLSDPTCPRYVLAPEGSTDTWADAERWREHSCRLNTVAFRMAEALGLVPEGADRVEAPQVEELLDQILARLAPEGSAVISADEVQVLWSLLDADDLEGARARALDDILRAARGGAS